MTAETLVFLAGLAAEPVVRHLILGDHEARPAQAAGLALVAAINGPWAVARREEGAANGVLVTLDAAQLVRLDFALRALGLTPDQLPALSARTWLGQGAGPASAADQTVLVVLTALLPDILTLQGMVPPEAVARRLHAMLVRAASTCRAGKATPATLRHDAAGPDVSVAAVRLPYAHFFSVEEYDVSWRRFDGSASETVTRAAFISGDAVTVLPYDPLRDRVLVVEQFRAGPLARGDRQSWQIEAIAGRVDPFETPEAAARREAVEEAGLTLTELIEVARYYPSPGAVSEYLYSYLALTDLPDGSAGVFGVEGEAEDICGHLITFDRLMDLVASGEIANAPLILTALWLQRERPRFR